MLRNSQGRMGYEQIVGDTMVWHPTPSPGLAVGGAVSSDPAYSVVGIGDFNRDGTSDVMMRSAAGNLGYQTVSGDIMNWHPLGSSDASYAALGVGDFNHDSIFDVMMRNAAGFCPSRRFPQTRCSLREQKWQRGCLGWNSTLLQFAAPGTLM